MREPADISIDGDPAAPGSIGIINDRLLEALDRLGSVRAGSGAPSAHLRVRHTWPPDWSAPPDGTWILMQPWEYGTIPDSWLAPIQGMVDEVWVCSEYVRQGIVASGIPATRVRVVPYGVDSRRFHPHVRPHPGIPGAAVRFLAVGGTIWRKGTDILLTAYARAFRRSDPVALIVKDQGVGTYYQGQTMGDQIRRLQRDPASPEIAYIDREVPHGEMPGLYAACTCLVHPYRGEGFALPVAEALACGKPVVVTSGGPTDEFVPDSACWRVPAARRRLDRVGAFRLARPGWTLEPDQDALAALLREIAVHPRLCEARSHAARRAALGVSWDRAAVTMAMLARRWRLWPPRRAARAVLGPSPSLVAYLACPDWEVPSTVRRALDWFAHRAPHRDSADLYLWAPGPSSHPARRTVLEGALAALRGARDPRPRIALLGHLRGEEAMDTVISAVDAVAACGSAAERAWLARAGALGRVIAAGTPLEAPAAAPVR